MRRVRVKQVLPGRVRLDPDEAHHLRDVLRMGCGDAVEVFDADGRTGLGRLVTVDAQGVIVAVDEVQEASERRFRWTVASAVPKGSRADWMIEKLSELGADRFVALTTRRSVVHPEGKGKHERWMRIAEEAAKQSRRIGVMRIDPLTDLKEFLGTMEGAGWYFSTEPRAKSPAEVPFTGDRLSLLIGPEGGWTEEELQQLSEAGLTAVSLGTTILRTETAAVAAGAIVAAVVVPRAAGSAALRS